jgi:molecular chaperone DnaJ
MAVKRDFYAVLGVDRQATAEEIKRAYRKAAAANHPDRNPGDQQAIERFKEAAEAFDVLGDADKRALYDRYGHEAFASRNGGRGGFNDLSEIFGAFGDLFEGLFTSSSGGGSRRRATRGSSLRCVIELELREAAAGCARTLEIERAEFCNHCDGSGARPGSKPASCDYCSGRGQIVQAQGFFRIQTTCPACHGSGEIIRDRCPQCAGSGREHRTVKLEVKIPPGVDSGMQLCLRGEGEPGENGGPRGDLYCEIHVAEHPLFKRNGLDLLCAVPVSFTQAALGTEFEIPLLEGKQKITVPPGTQPGEVLRLRGKGMPDPHSRRRGDIRVEIQVEVPKKLSARQEELLRELAELERRDVSPHQKSFFEKLKDLFVAPGDDEAKV